MSDRLTKRFTNIRQILAPHAPIWSQEVLNYYPNSFEAYNSNWVEEIQALPSEKQWLLDSKESFSPLVFGPMRQLFEELNQLTTLDSDEIWQDKELFHPDDTTYLGVKDKKRHELQRFFAHFSKINREKNFSQITNIGGGVGHISRIFTQHFNLPSHDLDMSNELQEIGRKKLRLYPEKPNTPAINFVTLKLEESTPDELLAPYFHSDIFTTGLHTCGELASTHLKLAVSHQVHGILNFGCCYGLIENTSALNLSQEAKRNPLELSSHALTLATRSHREGDMDDFLLKKRVKAYRYALHLFNLLELDSPDFLFVGNGTETLYRGDFATYYLFMMNRLHKEVEVNANRLNSFFASASTQNLLEKMFAMDIIRWQFGRCLEFYILHDRALFLEDHHFQTSLIQLFEERESPRNIGILAFSPTKF